VTNWVSPNIPIMDLVMAVLPYTSVKVLEFRLDRITFGTNLEAGWGAYPQEFRAEMRIYDGNILKREMTIPVEINKDVVRQVELGFTYSPDSTVRVEVTEWIKALTGYILMHVHDITLEYSGKASVPATEIKRGDLEVDVMDENGVPIGGATVKVVMGDIVKTGATGSQGVIIFKELPYGTYEVTVSKSGYKGMTVSVVLDQSYKTVRITLVKLPTEGGPSLQQIATGIAIAGALIGGGYVVSSLIKRREKE